MLLIEIVTSTPQFYVLTVIDDSAQFIASALASFISEWIGALIGARAARSSFDPAKLATSLAHPRKIKPAQQVGEEARQGPAKDELAHDAAKRMRLLVTTKVAHEELGEKVALVAGCAVAGWVGGLSANFLLKVLALVLLEAASDIMKQAAYATSNIRLGSVRYTFHLPTLLGVALVGGGSIAALLASIRFNCMLGEGIVSVPPRL